MTAPRQPQGPAPSIEIGSMRLRMNGRTAQNSESIVRGALDEASRALISRGVAIPTREIGELNLQVKARSNTTAGLTRAISDALVRAIEDQSTGDDVNREGGAHA